ncbi:hypothetical protein NDU88_003244 [Pleurodeles waltl]|uniref:Secreted protein n=1 Tax=Pleurodeles waltl TaxID=8319 RepID=A0AAV7LEU0_PLEWA|nr:hypothetical protein NDU88_003244 [Pleurodeles waltl]
MLVALSPVVGRALLRAWALGSWRFGSGGRPSTLEPAGDGRLMPPAWIASVKTEGRPEIPVGTGEAVASPRDRPAHTRTASKRGPRHKGAEATGWNSAGEDHRVLDPDTGTVPVTLPQLLVSADQGIRRQNL